jgi:DnaB-like helicase N terminal domain
VTSPEVRAEQALLGAVLSDPAGQQAVLDLVRREDMYRPWHGQVLAAMQRLRGRGVLPGPLEVYAELQNDPDLPQPVKRDAVPLAGLMEAAPRAENAPAYAAMVIDGGIRQRMVLAGSRMAQAAGDLDANLDGVFGVVGQARHEVNACHARWETLPEPMRCDLLVPHRDDREYAEIVRCARAVRDEIGRLRTDLWVESSASVEQRLASIAERLAEAAAASASQRECLAHRRASREARPQGPEAEAAGVAALRDLSADPSQLALVRGWLRPSYFALAEQGELYAAIRDMHAAGRPVDPVTVSWEASRRGIQVDAADLKGGTGAFAWSSAQKVRRHGLLAQIAQAGRDIQANAGDPSLPPQLLMRAIGDRLRHLERDSRAQPQRQPNAAPHVITMTRRADCRRWSRQAGREATR